MKQTAQDHVESSTVGLHFSQDYSSVSNKSRTTTLATVFYRVIESAIKLGYDSVLNEHKPGETCGFTLMATLIKAFPSSLIESAFCWGSYLMATSHLHVVLKHLCLEKQQLSKPLGGSVLHEEG